jgi:single-stranded-DNA-specific exonuclease
MSWGPGILGLIAQKIIDETGKPVFVWGQGDDKAQVKGSCRSLGDVSVVDLMAHVGHSVFTHWGGHEGAGGFSLLIDNTEKLSDALNESLKHIEKKEVSKKGLEVDAVMSIDDVHDMTYEAIAVLAPFGEGNRKPVFEIQDPRVLATKWFGKKGEHFEVVYATSQGGKVKAIQFFAPKDIEEKVNKQHSVLVHLERSYFGGRVELRMRIVEVR